MSKVHLIFGQQGAGKSTYSKKLCQEINAVHYSIDEWMWKLYGADLPQPMNIGWIMERVDRCEKHIWSMAKQVVTNGCEVVLDLGFPKSVKRNAFKKLAQEIEVPVQVHFLNAPRLVRRQRVLDRNNEKGETYSFEVTGGMFDFMEGEFDALTASDLEGAVVIDTHAS